MNSEMIKYLERIEHKLNVVSSISENSLSSTSHYFKRNALPNDSGLSQKLFCTNLSGLYNNRQLNTEELMDYGFRVFSQNDEDGIILAIFSIIGFTNKKVLEIGSNCNESDLGIPENCSTNLIVNHNWHGTIIDIDTTACEQLTYFFARNFSTKHFHHDTNGDNSYYNPVIMNNAVSPENVEQLILNNSSDQCYDLIVVDIDGEDFNVVKNILRFKPRVLIVEFEKRLKDQHSVYQSERSDFNCRFNQSGTVSLAAWEKLLLKSGYSLVAVNHPCFNAFFVLDSENDGKIQTKSAKEIFLNHNVFDNVSTDFWVEPDSSWNKY